MAFKKVGDWEKAANLVANLSREVVEARDIALKLS